VKHSIIENAAWGQSDTTGPRFADARKLRKVGTVGREKNRREKNKGSRTKAADEGKKKTTCSNVLTRGVALCSVSNQDTIPHLGHKKASKAALACFESVYWELISEA